MTSTLNPRETTTIDVTTYRTRPPVLRRSDASGEFPFYQPQTIGDVDEMARLALGATLVLPIGAEPAPPRHAVPTVYMPAPAEADEDDPFAGWSASADADEAETQPVIDLAAAMPQPERRRRPLLYQGRRRMVEPPLPRQPLPRWAFGVLLYGAGAASSMALLLVAARVLAAFR